MKWKYHPSYRRARATCKPFLIPFTAFQLIRTLFLPTPIDVILLMILLFLTVAVYLDWI